MKNQHFSEGIIELDLRGNDREGESFVGLAFYGEDNATFDCVYFRPFLFDTEVPEDQKTMIQYLSLPEFGYYRLREERPYAFEAEIANPPAPDDWFHVKLVIKTGRLMVYINDAKDPDMNIPLLNPRRKSGKLGLWVGYMSSGKFANLEIREE